MTTVLVVEDDPDVLGLLSAHLMRDGYVVRSATDGASARVELARGGFDCVLLDLMLPHVSGGSLLTEFRRTSDTAVIVVSAKDAAWTKVDLLRMGADDYITKPFDLAEVSARIDTVVRRSRPTPDRVLTHGSLCLDPAAGRASVGDKEVTLTVTELRILEVLMAAPTHVRSKASIHEDVWGEPYPGRDTAIKTHLSHLRSKLREVDPSCDYIETVWGLGYRLRRLSD